MATEIDIISSNIQIPVDSKKRRLCMIIKITLPLLIIAVIVIPTTIILTRKTDTTTETMMNMTVSFITTTSVSLRTLSSTTTVTTSITKPFVLQTFQRTNETVFAIWNTIARGDSSPSSPNKTIIGAYYPGEPPEAALDGNLSSEYTNHGVCLTTGSPENECGIQTGFYITFNSEPFILVKFRIATNKYSAYRDPYNITIEGSNNNESDLIFGKSWTLIYNGDAGLAKDPERQKYGNEQTIPNDPLPFASYRILTTSKRGKETCVSYSEFEMRGRFPD
ncbi:unnamed protein product [Adineta steineri]|uniref:Uncharacterized protein n=1 Tax=Adineta steineri TaxID=433720 RepID=A0A815Q100_9BILA|nr:unnamed protein product [Adineta steineri]CAF1386899.1 unnamed protein product [Adineta steineri]CAF1456713.1 unnamed protein product [Adineta steineri]